LLTRADLQTQVDGIRATAYPRAHGKTFDIAMGGSTAEPVTVRCTALTQLFLCIGPDYLDTVLQLRPPFAWHKPDGLRGVT
jgi:hypothetical protein